MISVNQHVKDLSTRLNYNMGRVSAGPQASQFSCSRNQGSMLLQCSDSLSGLSLKAHSWGELSDISLHQLQWKMKGLSTLKEESASHRTGLLLHDWLMCICVLLLAFCWSCCTYQEISFRGQSRRRLSRSWPVETPWGNQTSWYFAPWYFSPRSRRGRRGSYEPESEIPRHLGSCRVQENSLVCNVLHVCIIWHAISPPVTQLLT